MEERWRSAPAGEPHGSAEQFSVRPATLAAILVATAVLFAITFFFTRAYKNKEAGLARQMFSRGQQELSSGHPRKAVADLRTALYYSRDDRNYRLALAQALAADHRIEEATLYFMSLWESEPGNGFINLELAR